MLVGAGSAVEAYGCRFGGADGFQYYDVAGNSCLPVRPGSGVVSQSSGSFLFLSDCELIGGDSPGCGEDVSTLCLCYDGGTGLRVTAGEVVVLDSILTGGSESTNIFECDVTSPGASFTGTPQFLSGRPLRVSAVSPVHENGNYELHFEGTPHAPVFVRYAGFALPRMATGSFRGVELLPSAPSSGLAWLGFTDGNGILDRSIPVGPLPPGRQSALTFVQFFHLDSPALPGGHLILRSPPVPKSYLLGAGSMITVLDEAF